MSKDLQQVWETYAAAWKAATADEKARALQASVDAAAVYCDPLVEARGYAAIVEYMLDFHRQVPGGYFITTKFWSHHQRSIANWNMCSADGTVIGHGVSYGAYDTAGKLTTMTGFFDVPSAAT